ncbi:uncharacterized protein LOC135478132 [Liolophura sinensis]|uniref:uncharacterized protein LOC135478132 n=1 Tax=Liolophura sinensis TaxID=3198878 RepID=UPI0031580577
MSSQIVVVMLVVIWSGGCSAHGRMWDPPGRSTMWRVGFSTPRNYNDNSLGCGGRYIHQTVSRGQCGICGDNFQDPQPRANEAGGRYGRGILVRTYSQGETISVHAELTANHKGWMEFKICPNNDVNKIATQACLDQYVLQKADGTGTKTIVPTDQRQFYIDLVLPKGLTCSQCVVQWKYHAGTSIF